VYYDFHLFHEFVELLPLIFSVLFHASVNEDKFVSCFGCCSMRWMKKRCLICCRFLSTLT